MKRLSYIQGARCLKVKGLGDVTSYIVAVKFVVCVSKTAGSLT